MLRNVVKNYFFVIHLIELFVKIIVIKIKFYNKTWAFNIFFYLDSYEKWHFLNNFNAK